MTSVLKVIALIGVTVALAGCERFGDHPESFIRVSAGSGGEIGLYVEDGYLLAEGVWTIDGPDKIAAPINQSSIQCRLEELSCDVRRVEIITLTGDTVLITRYDAYAITQWSPTEVRAKLEGVCRTHEIKIDISGKTVVEMTNNTPGGSCEGFESPVDRPRMARMISGQQLEDMKKEGL